MREAALRECRRRRFSTPSISPPVMPPSGTESLRRGAASRRLGYGRQSLRRAVDNRLIFRNTLEDVDDADRMACSSNRRGQPACRSRSRGSRAREHAGIRSLPAPPRDTGRLHRSRDRGEPDIHTGGCTTDSGECDYQFALTKVEAGLYFCVYFGVCDNGTIEAQRKPAAVVAGRADGAIDRTDQAFSPTTGVLGKRIARACVGLHGRPTTGTTARGGSRDVHVRCCVRACCAFHARAGLVRALGSTAPRCGGRRRGRAAPAEAVLCRRLAVGARLRREPARPAGADDPGCSKLITLVGCDASYRDGRDDCESAERRAGVGTPTARARGRATSPPGRSAGRR